MRTIVTGGAGFIGSHLCAHLLSAGDEVVAVDAFTDYYDVARKHANVARLQDWDRFRLVSADVAAAPWAELLDGVDVVYHLAGQPGVRPSWGREFPVYVERNVLATQVLLEALRDRPLQKLVYASSSSVYGDAESYPTVESMRPQPVSPYGVTKLAAEHLCELYRSTNGLRTVSLRLFTVYGPGQRPDMAFSRLVRAGLDGGTFQLFGSGEQTRDFTFVDDVVRAFRDAAHSSFLGVANVGGGSRTSMRDVVSIVRELTGGLEVVSVPAQPGDVRDTAADTSVALEGFGYRPRTTLVQGLASMVDAERAGALVPAVH